MGEQQEIQRFVEAKRAALDAFERAYFTVLDERAKGNVSEMARLSGMERAHVRAYLERHGIGRPAREYATMSAELDAMASIVRPRAGETVLDAARRLAGITCRCTRPGGDQLTRRARGLACQPPGYERKYACKCPCHSASSPLVSSEERKSDA